MTIIKKFSGGGSESEVVLMATQNGLVVRKHGKGHGAEKLKQQYSWLKKHQSYPVFPKVISDFSESDGYHYDMEYYENAIPLKEVICISPKEAFVPVKSLIDFFFENIYRDKISRNSPPVFLKYVREKILDKLDIASAQCSEVKEMLDYTEVEINGKKYTNIKPLIDEMLNDKNIMGYCSEFNECTVHGNLTVENLFVNNGQILALDPNNENIISDPLLDIANLYQSLYSGYEYIPAVKNLIVSGNKIRFEESCPEEYKTACSMLYDYIFSRYFTGENDEAKLVFHGAVHYTRLLPYKMKLQRPLIVCYLSKAILLLNESFELFKKKRTTA